MAEVGNRVEVTARKGAPRFGVVTAVNGGMVTVQWDSGEESSLIPGPGVLSVVPGHRRPPKKAAAKVTKATKTAAKATKTAAKATKTAAKATKTAAKAAAKTAKTAAKGTKKAAKATKKAAKATRGTR